ncbi:hypothetical protein [Winogradskyella sp. 3972H.M.0a.05]|uniref:hypothetical protein n=1 Tax=Winogradskyella sp. 3972H.M.0a.05 TaxID=2950277 RepID=UPI0033994CC8
MSRYLIIVFAFISTLGYSQEWEHISTSDDGKEVFMRPHSKSSAWIKTTNIDVYKSYLDSEPVKGEIITLYRFDCEKLKIGTLATIQYDNEGKVVRSDQTEEILVKMEYPYPDSYGELFLKTFCKSHN